MTHFLRLVRFPNLVVVALTQSLVFYGLLRPAFGATGLVTHLQDWQFVLLTTATCLVAAAGYIINDLADQPIDGHPALNRRVVGVNTPESVAVWWFFLLTLLGFLGSVLLALSLQEGQWLWLFPLAGWLLAGYSHWVKPHPLAGNLLVAWLCMGVVALVLLAERRALGLLAEAHPTQGVALRQILVMYLVYAGLSTLARELVKDLEDAPADAEYGRRTVPIAWGVQVAKRIVYGLLAALLVAVVAPLVWAWPAFTAPNAMALAATIGLATLAACWRLWRANQLSDYTRLSQVLKGIMAAGLLWLYVLSHSFLS